LPASREDVFVAITVDVDGELAAVDDVFVDGADFAEAVGLPVGSLIPKGSAYDVKTAIAVNVEDADALAEIAGDLVQQEAWLAYDEGSKAKTKQESFHQSPKLL
jgi:hypothetical protein